MSGLLARLAGRDGKPASAGPDMRIQPVAWPLVGEFMLGMSVPMVGLYLASVTSDAAAASFGLGQQLLETLVVLFRALAIGGGVVVTRLIGSGQTETIRRTTFALLAACTWAGLAAAAWLLLGNRITLDWLNAPAETLEASARFMMLLAPALLLESYNLAMASVLRAHLLARESLRIMFAVQVLHLVLAVALMRGIGPVPALGIDGYALAMLCSRLLGLVLHLLYWRHGLGLQPVARDWWVLRLEVLRPVLRVGLPGAGMEMLYRLAFMVSLSATARLGVSALAAHAYTLQILKYVLVPSLSIGRAVEILVGRLVGAGRLKDADTVTRQGTRLSLLASGCLALLAALAGPWLLPLFTSDAAIIELARVLLWMSVALELGRAWNLTVLPALRASGDNHYPVWTHSGSLVLLLAGGSYLLGPVLGLAGIWLAYVVDECLRGWLMWWRWRRRGWLPHARQVLRQLRQSA